GVIGAGAGVAAVAYAIHTNKERIAHSLEGAKISLETPIQTLKYAHMKSSMAELDSLREQEEAFLKETEQRKQKIDTYIKPIIETINSYTEKKALLKKELFEIELAQETSIVNILKAPVQIAALKYEIRHLNKEIKERTEHIRGILETEEKMVSRSSKKIHDSTINLYGALDEIQATKERIFALSDEDKRIKEESRYVDWAKNIGDMSWTEVRALHSDLRQHFSENPASKDAVRAFLIHQNHSVAQFESDPATVVLEYLAKEVTV
ncbi:MAG: hypothetical protein JSR46_07680, partial [Verrucomicrobia bacterium]|nr:hypothetical protein [Verrucomicrobiota bacterium]